MDSLVQHKYDAIISATHNNIIQSVKQISLSTYDAKITIKVKGILQATEKLLRLIQKSSYNR